MTSLPTLAALSACALFGWSAGTLPGTLPGPSLPPAPPPTPRAQAEAPESPPPVIAAQGPQFFRLDVLRDLPVRSARGSEEKPLGVLREVLIDSRDGGVRFYGVRANAAGTSGAAATRSQKLVGVVPKSLEWQRDTEGAPAAVSKVTTSRFASSPAFDVATLRAELGRGVVEAASERTGKRGAAGADALTPEQRAEAYRAGLAFQTSAALRGLEVRSKGSVEAVAKVATLVLHADRHRVAFAELTVGKERVLVPWSKLALKHEGEDRDRVAFLELDGSSERLADAPREEPATDATLDSQSFRDAVLRHFAAPLSEGR